MFSLSLSNTHTQRSNQRDINLVLQQFQGQVLKFSWNFIQNRIDWKGDFKNIDMTRNKIIRKKENVMKKDIQMFLQYRDYGGSQSKMKLMNK